MNEEKRYSFDEVVKEAYIEEQVTKKLEEADEDINDFISRNIAKKEIEQEYEDKNTEGTEIGNINNKKDQKSLKIILQGLGIEYKEFQKLKTTKGYAFSEKTKNFLVKALVIYHTDKRFRDIFSRRKYNEIIFNNIDGLLEEAVELNEEVMFLLEGLNDMLMEERKYQSLESSEEKIYQYILKDAINSFDYHRRKKEYEITKIFLNSIKIIRTKKIFIEEIDLPSDTDCYWLNKFEECMKKDLKILEQDLDYLIRIRTNMRRIYIKDIYEKLSLNPLEEKDDQFENEKEMYEILQKMEEDFSVQKMINDIEKLSEEKINKRGLVILVQLLGLKSYENLTYREMDLLRGALGTHFLLLQDKDYKQFESRAKELYEWIRKRVKRKIELLPTEIPQIPKEQLYEEAVKRTPKCNLYAKINNNNMEILLRLEKEINKNKLLKSENSRLKARLRKVKKNRNY